MVIDFVGIITPFVSPFGMSIEIDDGNGPIVMVRINGALNGRWYDSNMIREQDVYTFAHMMIEDIQWMKMPKYLCWSSMMDRLE